MLEGVKRSLEDFRPLMKIVLVTIHPFIIWNYVSLQWCQCQLISVDLLNATMLCDSSPSSSPWIHVVALRITYRYNLETFLAIGIYYRVIINFFFLQLFSSSKAPFNFYCLTFVAKFCWRKIGFSIFLQELKGERNPKLSISVTS